MKEDGGFFYIVDGIYTDNNSRGYFELYMKRADPLMKMSSHIMLIKFNTNFGNLLDKEARDNLCRKAVTLITPLVKP